MKDLIVPPLRRTGDYIVEALSGIPLEAVQVLFISVMVITAIGVIQIEFRRDRSDGRSWWSEPTLYAVFLLTLQCALLMIFD